MHSINFEKKLIQKGAEIEHRYKDIRVYCGSKMYLIFKREGVTDYSKDFKNIYKTHYKK